MARSVILTARQNEVLKFVKDTYRTQDRLPTTPELKAKFNITDTHANYFIGVLMLKGAFGHKVQTNLTVADTVNRPSTVAPITVAAPVRRKPTYTPQALANLRANAAKARAAKLMKQQHKAIIATFQKAGLSFDSMEQVIDGLEKAGVKF